jgi:glycosyltransferase involved in cell wall biosynthesis
MPETLAAALAEQSNLRIEQQSTQSRAPDLSIAMPVYNEEQALPRVLKEAAAAFYQVPFTFEIVVVDDASTDASLIILEDFQRNHPGLKMRILRHESNCGIMASFNTLFAAAAGNYVFINGSDGQCATADCVRMMELRDQFDVVVGKRQGKKYTAWRALISWGFNALPRLLFGVQTYDAGSVKLYRREVLEIGLLSRGPFREAERLIRARRRGFRIGMIPIEHRLRTGGTATGARWCLVARSVADLLHCWWDIVVCGRP